MVRSVNFSILGVPATVTVPGNDPVETRIIWLTPNSEGSPEGTQLQFAEAKPAMAIRRDDVPALVLGTLVEVAPHNLDAPTAWEVDSIEKVEQEHVRVLVVPVVDT